MNSKEIQQNVQAIFDDFHAEEFIFDFLIAYGISKTSITRLKKGDFNLSKNDGEVLYKKKVFFKVEKTDQLLLTIDSVTKDERILKHKPRFAIATDYKTVVAKDLKLGKNLDIAITELPNYFDFFLPLAGSEVYNSSNDNEADRNASYKMATLYDLLIEENPQVYTSKESVHRLNIFLSRLLFCFFAKDTEIFEEDSIFTNTLVQHTTNDGSDTHEFLNQLFERLNVKDGSSYPAYLAKFPYVNGGLFKDKIDSPKFTLKARKTLIELGELQWKDINPDIFGSMIQAVVMPEYRSDLGMHYTSVPNILKLIKPLFLDELYEEFEKATTIKQLERLIRRISKMKFFDPACGSGNFLIITYKEIRVLEIEIIQKIIELSYPQTKLYYTQIQLSQFYGIELDHFAHEMAILSLWLAEHQMNRVFEERLFDFGRSRPILPLKEAGQIQQGNATRLDWKTVCPIDGEEEVYIIGNPPYLGKSSQDKNQKSDMDYALFAIKKYKSLDYIAIWFYKGKKYIEGNNAKLAFVSTNSITQGEQVAAFWPSIIFNTIEICFAYQSFKWTNNAKGNAGVTVVIIGLRNTANSPKYLFSGNLRKGAKNISPYLIDVSNTIILGRSQPMSSFPEMTSGCKITDDGNLILGENQKRSILSSNPELSTFIRKFIGAHDFISGDLRYCIYVIEDSVYNAYNFIELTERFEKVKLFRLNSKKLATQKKAVTPHFFDEDKHQRSDYLFIPRHSSENRSYIPIGFFDENTIAGDSALVVYNAEPWLFAVITSRMHMVWVRTVGGKLKADYRYSAKLCYNTFPFPEISTKQKESLNLYVFAILDERAKHPTKTLAQLYNPETMPKGLKQAHQELDEAIEKCYRLQPFKSDTERLEYLFKRYEEMLAKDTLFAKQKKSRKKKK